MSVKANPSSVQSSVTLEQEDFELMQRALKLADGLCTDAISGRTSQAKALEFARVYNDLKRKKIVPNK